MDDAEAGAGQELALLYEEYAQPLQRYLWRLTGSREQAEDLMQETFVKALRAYSRRRSDDQLGAWLFRIARNSALDSFRHDRLRPSTPLSDIHLQTLAAESVGPALDEAEPVREALAQLPPAYRDLLLLHSYADYSLKAIVALLGVKESTVKSRLHRARAHFRRHYQGDEASGATGQ